MQYMVLIFILPSFISAISVEDIKSRAEITHRSCFEKTRATMETVAAIRSYQYDVNDEVLRNQILCYAEDVGFINSSGVLNKELMMKRLAKQKELTPERIEKFEECARPKKSDETVAVYAATALLCLGKNLPDFVFM